MLYPRLRFDMVRPGIATYGIWPSARNARCGAARTRARTGAGVDDAARRRARRRSGPLRRLRLHVSHRARVAHRRRADRLCRRLTAGALQLPAPSSSAARRAPIVGRVCMNMAFVDVTDVPHAAPGSTVTLIGARRRRTDRCERPRARRGRGTIAATRSCARFPAESCRAATSRRASARERVAAEVERPLVERAADDRADRRSAARRARARAGRRASSLRRSP